MNIVFDNLKISYPLELSEILDVNMECSFGGHPTFELKAIIPEGEGARYVQSITEDTKLTVSRKKKDSEKVIFCGYTDSVKVFQEGGLYIARIHAVAYTAKLDIEKKSRTFFKKGVTYHEILEAVTKDYKGVQMKELVKTKRATAFPILQYNETDWEFIKRIAAMFEAVITPDCTEEFPRFYIGRHKSESVKEIDKTALSTFRDLKYCYEDYFKSYQAFSIPKLDQQEKEEEAKKKAEEKKKKALQKQARKKKKMSGATMLCQENVGRLGEISQSASMGEMLKGKEKMGVASLGEIPKGMTSKGIASLGEMSAGTESIASMGVMSFGKMSAEVQVQADALTQSVPQLTVPEEDWTSMLSLMAVAAQGGGDSDILLSALTGAAGSDDAISGSSKKSSENNRTSTMKENYFTFYTIQSRSYYPLGTMLTLKNGEKGMVSHVDGYTNQEQVWYEYVIREAKGIVARYENNPNLAGISLIGTVKKRIGNMVSLNLEIDQDDGYHSDKEDYFFTYALETKDYYCMPVEGATIHLYFPTGKEWEAIAVNSLRNEADASASRGSKISNPDNRSLSNDFGVTLDMTPDHINLTPHDDNSVYIKLEKTGDITMAGKNISISAKDIELGKAESEDGEIVCKSLSLEAGSTVFMARVTGEGESAAIIEDHVMGIESYTQIVSTDKIMHWTTGSAKPPAVSYDETELQAQEKEQIDAANKQVEDMLIERKKSALGKFGMGLLMCAVGAALIVATGGVAAVAIGAGMAVFGAAEMQEAADSRALAESGDWSTPAKNSLKDALGEPLYTILKDGFVIAGSIVTAGMLGIGAGSILAAGAVNTAISVAFDLIPDGKLDTSLLDYLDSFATGALIGAITGPIGKLGTCGKFGTEFASRFGQQMASSMLFGLTSGDLTLESIGEMGVRELLSSLISSAMPQGTSKLVKMLMDTGADSFIDSAEQLYKIWKNGGSLSDFDFKRLLQTAATSCVNNMLFSCDPVNCVRGNLFCFREDISSRDLYGDFTFQRRYDSVLQYKGSMGNGWIHEYESMFLMDNKDTIRVMLPDSHMETFLRQKDGSWINENGGTRVYELVYHEKKRWVELTSREGGEYKKYRYDGEGRLIAVFDKPYQKEPITVQYREEGYMEMGDVFPRADDMASFTGAGVGAGSTANVVTRAGTDSTAGAGASSTASTEADAVAGSTASTGADVVAGFTASTGADAVAGFTASTGTSAGGANTVTASMRRRHAQIDRITSPGGRTLYFQYENNYLVMVSDDSGRKVRYEYASGCLVRAHYTTGGKQDYHYDRAGKLVSMSGEDGRAFLTNVYDEKGRVVRQEYPDGNFCAITYEDRKKFTTFTFSESGRQEKYFYDEKNQITRTEWRQGIVDGKNTGGAGNRVPENAARGTGIRRPDIRRPDLHRSDIRRPAAGNRTVAQGNDVHMRGENIPQSVSTGDKPVLPTEFETLYSETCVFDSCGNKIEETDKNGNTTFRTFNAWGCLLEERLADGTVRNFAYNDAHKKIKEWDSTGACTEYAYDENENLVEKKVWLTQKKCAVTTYKYDEYGRLLSAFDPLENETVYVYNDTSHNQPTVVENPDGSRYQYGYDYAGRRTEITTEYGTVRIGYSETGEETLITDAMGNTTRKYVDAAGNILKLVPPNLYEGEGRASQGYIYDYDYLDRQIKAISPDGSVHATPVDMDGNVKKDISPDGYDAKTGDGWGITYEYDCCQYKVKETLPEGGVRRYLYDGNGNIIKVIQPEEYALHGEDGQGISYEYDERNQLVSVVDADGNVIRHFVYDGAGRLVKEMNGEGYASGATDEERYGTVYRYNRAGWLLEKREPVSRRESDGVMLYCVTAYEYDLAGNRIKEKRSRKELTVDEIMGMCLEISMEYDSRNRLVKVSDSLGAAVEYAYDSLNSRISEKARINETKYRMMFYDYDSCGRLSRIRQAVDFEDLGEEPKQYVKKAFAITEYGYDKNGNVTEVKLPEGGRILREYDVCDRMVKETLSDEANGIRKVTEFGYDRSGRMVTETDGLGYQEATEYDRNGNVIRKTDKEGNVSRYFYDQDGNLVKAVSPRNYDKAQDDGAGTAYEYDGSGRVVRVTNALGFVEEENAYDVAGRLIRKADGTGTLAEYAYDAGGRMVSIRVPRDGWNDAGNIVDGISTSDGTGTRAGGFCGGHHGDGLSAGGIQSDSMDKVISLDTWSKSSQNTDTFASCQIYKYDARGNITGIQDGEGNQTSYEMDEWGRITAIQKPDGSRESFAYDYAGNISETTDGNGGTIAYAYNSFGRLGSITDQAGEKETFSYDKQARIAGHVDRDGRETRYGYQMMDSLLYQKAARTGELYTYGYNEQGQLVEADGGGVRYGYEYTANGNVRTKYRNGKAALIYGYGADGAVESITDLSGKRTQYTYDVLGRAVRVADNGKVLAEYGYHEDGNLASVTFGNGIVTTYGYGRGKNLTSLETRNPDGSVLMAFQYTYDGNGNRTGKTGTKDGREYNTQYGYDALQRVSKVQYPGGNWEEFAYDRAGNRSERLTGTWRETYEYDVRNRLRKRSRTDTLAVNGNAAVPLEATQTLGAMNDLGVSSEKAMPSVTALYSYDHQGNTLTEETWKGTSEFTDEKDFNNSGGLSGELIKKTTYEYNGFLKTSRTTVRDYETVSGFCSDKDASEKVHVQENFYDAENFRYGIMEDGERTDFVSNGWDVYTELGDGDKVKNRLVRGYGIVAAEQEVLNGTESSGLAYFYYHGDEHNDVSYITGEDGYVKNRYEYDAFGCQTRAEEIIRNRYGYNGEQYDGVTEQYYLRARFYNPAVARFTQEDVYRGDGLNLYAYCGNNAVMYEDPSGYGKASNGKCTIGTEQADETLGNCDTLLRGDSALHSDTRPNGIRKSYISTEGSLVPANIDGMYKGRQVTVTEHILGGYRKGAKGNSPYTSFTFNRDIVAGYGNTLIEIDISGLRKAIQSGEVTDVAILSPKQIERLIKNDKIQSDFWKKRALSWTKRDSEYLIRGKIPSKFVKINK